MPAQGQGLPIAAQAGLPATFQGASLPTAADTGFPAAFGDGAAAGRAPAFGDIAFGDEIALDAGPQGRSSAFDDSDRAVPAAMDPKAAADGPVGIDVDAEPPRAAVGDEADLAAPPPVPMETAQVAAPRRPREAEAPVRKSNAGRAALVAAVLLTLTGGALTMSPTIGPFGAHLISDQINAGKYAASLAALRAATGALLDEDTYASASAAIERCKAAGAEMPRHRPTAAYCAEVTLQRGLRFGRRSDDEASAQQLLTVAADGGGDAAALAKAALDVLGDRAAQARGPVAALAQRAPGDVDVAVVAAYVELADKAAVKAAVAAWQHAVSMKKSARTLYGLARAQRAAGDAAGAEASATGRARSLARARRRPHADRRAHRVRHGPREGGNHAPRAGDRHRGRGGQGGERGGARRRLHGARPDPPGALAR